MSRIRIPRLWEVERGKVTSLSDYLHRRSFLRRTGLPGLGALGWASCRPKPGDDASDGADAPTLRKAPVAVPDVTLRETLRPVQGSAFEPCTRVTRYTVDRPGTDELVAARYNNFYEFGRDKEACWRQAQQLTVRPWALDISGLVARPMTIGIDDLIKRMPCEERLHQFRCVERWAMVVPWKYGYKGAKSIVRIEFTAERPRTFWNDHAPQEYGFFSNVDPNKPHPRWSQAKETMIGTGVEYDTRPYNGYATYVAAMYTGNEH